MLTMTAREPKDVTDMIGALPDGCQGCGLDRQFLLTPGGRKYRGTLVCEVFVCPRCKHETRLYWRSVREVTHSQKRRWERMLKAIYMQGRPTGPAGA